jgi:hypothetical protein
MRRGSTLFAALTLALTVALALMVRENQRLRQALIVMAKEKARASGLDVGQRLGPIALHDATGAPVNVRFEGEAAGSVLLFHASACGACEATRPQWKEAIAQVARPDVRVLCLQTDVVDGAPLTLEGLPPSLAVPLPPVGWLAALPAIPATLVVDGIGVVTWAWYGELTSEATSSFAAALAALGGSADSTAR